MVGGYVYIPKALNSFIIENLTAESAQVTIPNAFQEIQEISKSGKPVFVRLGHTNSGDFSPQLASVLFTDNSSECLVTLDLIERVIEMTIDNKDVVTL